MPSLWLIATISTQMPNWVKESYTLLVMGVLVIGIVWILKALHPLYLTSLKINEERTKQAEASRMAADSVERTTHELSSMVKDAAAISAAQAKHAETQLSLTEKLIRLEERFTHSGTGPL